MFFFSVPRGRDSEYVCKQLFEFFTLSYNTISVFVVWFSVNLMDIESAILRMENLKHEGTLFCYDSFTVRWDRFVRSFISYTCNRRDSHVVCPYDLNDSANIWSQLSIHKWCESKRWLNKLLVTKKLVRVLVWNRSNHPFSLLRRAAPMSILGALQFFTIPEHNSHEEWERQQKPKQNQKRTPKHSVFAQHRQIWFVVCG